MEYVYPLGADGQGGTITPRWDFAFKDDVFFDPTNGVGVDPRKEFPRYALGQPAYWVHNLRLGWRSPSEPIFLLPNTRSRGNLGGVE